MQPSIRYMKLLSVECLALGLLAGYRLSLLTLLTQSRVKDTLTQSLALLNERY